MASTCNLAILSSYKEERQLYFAYLEVLNGIGNLFGPIIGAILYSFGGYTAPFYGTATIFTIILVYFRVAVSISD